jgi:hypothetical protein
MDKVVHDVHKKFDEEEINQCRSYFLAELSSQTRLEVRTGLLWCAFEN